MDNNNETMGTTEELIGNQPIYQAPVEPEPTEDVSSDAVSKEPEAVVSPDPEMGMTSELANKGPMQAPQMYGEMPAQVGKKAKKVKTPKVKKPMTKGKIAGIIIGSVVAAAAVVCGIIFIPRLFSSPKDVVVDAFQNTFGIGAMSDDKFGTSDILETFQEEGGNVSFEATMENVVIDDAYSGFSVSSNIAVDPQAQIVNSNANVSYNDNSIVTVNLVGTTDNTYVELPDMFNGYFMLPNDLAELLSSPMLSGVLSPSEVDFLKTYLSAYQINYFPDSDTNLNSGYINAGETLWDSVSVKRKGKEKITVNGKTVKARKYVVSLSEKDFKKFIQEMVDGVIESLQSNPALANQPDYNNVLAVLNSVDLSSYISGELNFDVYIKDDKIVKIESDNTLKIMSYLNIGFKGYFDIDEDGIGGDFSVTTMGQTLANVSFSTVKTTNGDVDEYEVTGQVSSQGISLATFEVDAKVNDKENTYNVKASFNAAGQSVGFTMDSQVDDYVKGQYYNYHINSLSFTYDGFELFTVSANYNIDVTNNAKPSNIDNSLPVYDLTVITPDGANQILAENQALLQNWAVNVMNIPGLNELIKEEEEEEEIEIEEPDAIDPEYPDLLSLNLDNYEVIINGIPGDFFYDYSDAEYIQFSTENASTLSYAMAVTDNPVEYVNTFFEGVDDSNLLESEMNQIVTVEGDDIHYSVITYESLGYKVSSYVFVRILDDTHVLYAKAYVYVDEDEYTLEDLAASVTDQCVYINE